MYILCIFFRETLDFGAHFIDDGLRRRDSKTAPDSHDPAQKLVADRDVHDCAEMILVHRHEGDILAETVDQNADHIIFSLYGDAGFFTSVHTEETAGVAGHIKGLEFGPAQPALPQDGDLQHFVDPVMLDL